jgi:hypothetical protein
VVHDHELAAPLSNKLASAGVGFTQVLLGTCVFGLEQIVDFFALLKDADPTTVLKEAGPSPHGHVSITS